MPLLGSWRPLSAREQTIKDSIYRSIYMTNKAMKESRWPSRTGRGDGAHLIDPGTWSRIYRAACPSRFFRLQLILKTRSGMLCPCKMKRLSPNTRILLLSGYHDLNKILTMHGRVFPAARLAGVYRTHLARTFRRYFGLSVSAYRRHALAEAAVKHFASGATLVTASSKAGFADQSHMTCVVKAETGFTPGVLRRLLLEVGGAT